MAINVKNKIKVLGILLFGILAVSLASCGSDTEVKGDNIIVTENGTKTIENKNSKISDLTKENKSLKKKGVNVTNENKNLKAKIDNLETEVRYLKKEIKKQIKITKEFDDRLAILEKEMKQLRAKKKNDIGKNQVNDKNINK